RLELLDRREQSARPRLLDERLPGVPGHRRFPDLAARHLPEDAADRRHADRDRPRPRVRDRLFRRDQDAGEQVCPASAPLVRGPVPHELPAADPELVHRPPEPGPHQYGLAEHRGDERAVARTPVFRVLGPRRPAFDVSAVNDFPDLARDEPIDQTVLAASADLGGRPRDTLFRVVVPLALPGILIGSIFVFVGVLGYSVVPEILGGATDSSRTLIANLIDKAISGQQYPMAAAIASIILLMAIGLIWGWERAFGLKKIGEI